MTYFKLMQLLLCCRKPKNQRVKRALEKREAKIHENDKTAIFIRGGHTSEVVTQVLNEMVLFQLIHHILVCFC